MLKGLKTATRSLPGKLGPSEYVTEMIRSPAPDQIITAVRAPETQALHPEGNPGSDRRSRKRTTLIKKLKGKTTRTLSP